MGRVRTFLTQSMAPLAAIPFLYVLFQAVAALVLGVRLDLFVSPPDLALHLLLGLALLSVSRGRWRFLVLMTVLMAVVHLGNAMKIVILGGPVMPDDMMAARSLFLILEGGWLVLALAAVAAVAVALACTITLRPRRAQVAVAGVAALVTLTAAVPGPTVAAMDALFGNTVWNQRGNYLERGPLLHMVQESVRHAARSTEAPDRGDVLAAAELLIPDLHASALPASMGSRADIPVRKPVGRTGRPNRNVHIIVLESFWDPTALTKAGIAEDPFVPEFRALWDAAGGSRALSPVFGGYTANAEFEALCGFPVTEDAVFFEGRLRNDVPCLPRLLAGAGYATVASHPNVAVFWNRVHAYRRIGFDVYWSDQDFALDDMNGEFLGDASLYRQVMAKVEPLLATDAPTLNYVLTFFGHLDYPLNAARSPVVKATNGDDRLELYLNTVHYKTAELMAFLAELRAKDPDGIVAIFGDHLPFLGPNFAGYTDSGLLAEDKGAFSDAMFRTMAATPLIVIDGRNGPLALGDVPLYHLPSIILDLLGQPVPSMMALTRTVPSFTVRPLPGLNVVLDGQGGVVACRDEATETAPACTAAQAWGDAVATLSADLFSGRQHILREGIVPNGRPTMAPVVVAGSGI